ncbi:MAG: carboxypeptidase-like regulatory domain-containing protein [Candidatus Sumerlaeaceae bacterium]|nr:carboxypeptidase-like regulatory domain-containing protein [Candidatus Sumerlaeaceae bacterium]
MTNSRLAAVVVSCVVIFAGVVWYANRGVAPKAPMAVTPAAIPNKIDPTVTRVISKEPARAASVIVKGSPQSGIGPTTITLTAHLRHSELGTSTEVHALVGPAFISDDDLLERQAWLARGGQGAGATDVLDLANVRSYLPAPTGPEGGGSLVGPMAVPRAPVYDIIAWPDDREFFRKRHTVEANATSIDAGELHGTPSTGLILEFTSNTLAQRSFVVRLLRGLDPADPTGTERASRHLPVVRAIRPDIADALQQGDTLLFSATGQNRLVPLLPDPRIRIVVSTVTGAEGKPVELELKEGQIRTAALDISSIFANGAADQVALTARVLIGNSQKPLRNASIERLDSPLPQKQRLRDDGSCDFVGLPAREKSQFEVTVDETTASRPLSPPRHLFTFDPGPETSGQATREIIWRIPALNWLTAEMDAVTAKAASSSTHPHFPIFALQRRVEPGGRWRMTQSDHFPREGNKVSASISQPGTFRLVVMLSPFHQEETAAVEFDENTGEKTASLTPRAATQRNLTVVSADGQPVAGAYVTVSGPSGSVPPAEGITNSAGQFNLGPVNVDLIHARISASGKRTVERDISVPPGQEDLKVQF